MIFVYYLSKENETPFYVGITYYPELRHKTHKRKFGNCNIHILEEIKTLHHSKAGKVEDFWINYFRFLGFKLENKTINRRKHKNGLFHIKQTTWKQ